jgi:predicted RNA-binding Zn ribbon-like protein
MNFAPMPALLLADAPGLDFLNSVATPGDAQIDWLADGEGLLSWIRQTGWVAVEALDALRAQFESSAFDLVAAQARELREWFRAYARARMGRPLTAQDLAELTPLNQLLARDARFQQIGIETADDAAGPALRLLRRWDSPESLLMVIAETLAQLVCEENFTYVKACEGARCTLMFADHTRGHARRWCSMALCGNRAKVAAHRARLKEQST